MAQHARQLVARDGVVVREATDVDELAVALELLDRCDSESGVPVVDEAERERLARAVEDASVGDGGWRVALAWQEGRLAGYVGLLVDAAAGEAVGDVADPEGAAGLDVLLAAGVRLAERHGASRVQVWTRQAGEREIDIARSAGFEVARRLAVLGRSLEGDLPSPPTAGATVRAYRPGTDDEAVVEVLAAAYGGTADAGWDLEQFEERRRLPWFRPEDLLVAELDDPDAGPALAGLHWLKRRDERTGEVYNLAVHPAAQGHRVGPLLLHAGLVHLRRQGCDDVILWVDLANERAVSLYRAQGFETRWLDLALARPR
jgi:mycothiol synthase